MKKLFVIQSYPVGTYIGQYIGQPFYSTEKVHAYESRPRDVRCEVVPPTKVAMSTV